MGLRWYFFSRRGRTCFECTTLEYSSFQRPYYNIIYYIGVLYVIKLLKTGANATNIMSISRDYRIKRVRIVHSRYHDHSPNTEHNKAMSGRLTDKRCRAVSILRLNHTGDMCTATSSMKTSGFFTRT